MRLFIAIRLSDGMQKSLVACMHDLKKQGVEGNFGNILWAGVKGNQKLKTYVKELRDALRENGVPFENDKFVPHITLIRKASAKKPYQVHLPRAEMTVESVSLMKSEMKNGKVVYQEL